MMLLSCMHGPVYRYVCDESIAHAEVLAAQLLAIASPALVEFMKIKQKLFKKRKVLSIVVKNCALAYAHASTYVCRIHKCKH